MIPAACDAHPFLKTYLDLSRAHSGSSETTQTKMGLSPFSCFGAWAHQRAKGLQSRLPQSWKDLQGPLPLRRLLQSTHAGIGDHRPLYKRQWGGWNSLEVLGDVQQWATGSITNNPTSNSSVTYGHMDMDQHIACPSWVKASLTKLRFSVLFSCSKNSTSWFRNPRIFVVPPSSPSHYWIVLHSKAQDNVLVIYLPLFW